MLSEYHVSVNYESNGFFNDCQWLGEGDRVLDSSLRRERYNLRNSIQNQSP
jgi:hypothetical protein